MPAADIQVNAVTGTVFDVAINVAVQLSNNDVGGELTYLWEILDQPEGAAVALSNPAIENPTFTPTKEGTYLIRLVVNAGASELIDKVKVSVRQFKTDARIPAAGETTEASTVKGWALDVNRQLQALDAVRADPGVTVCVNPGASFPVNGDIVRVNGVAVIKAGLPGEERLLLIATAPANVLANTKGTLGVVVGTPTGAGPAANGLVRVRFFGLVELTEAGAPAVGDPVYVSDGFQPALVAGSNARQIGKVVESSAGTWRWMIDGHIAVW